MAKKKLSEQRARLITRELLIFREWDDRAISNGGQLLEEAEYKHHNSLKNLFKGKSKTGKGDAYPDFLLVESSSSKKPIIVIETKASIKDLPKAIDEACYVYGEACIEKGHNVLAIGIAGGEKELFGIEVRKKINGQWLPLTLHKNAIDWIPSLLQTKKILANTTAVDVEPEKPSDASLAMQANKLNEILRECKIKDEYRPVYVATFMLALWVGDVSIEEDVVLDQINSNSQRALTKAGKQDLALSLRVDDENDELAARAWEIIDILKKLNIRSFIQEHDYLGQLYETFFRYTGGNTIGQYFTPRHIISFMCEIIDINQNDKILDPACGTGGFLVGALNHIVKNSTMLYEDIINIVKDNLFGIESEPTTAALCITNMILRGDGKSGIVKGDCFKLSSFPSEDITCVLMNPPFPHNKKTDTPTTDFLDRGLSSLAIRGKLAAVVPYSLLVRLKDWHKKITKNNTILMVTTLPSDLFNPYASYNTAIIIIEKGIPQNEKPVFFSRMYNDGFKIKKSVRVAQNGSVQETLKTAYLNKSNIPELCTYKKIDDEWSPEAYIENAIHSDIEFTNGLEESIKQQASFYIYNGYKLITNTSQLHKLDLTVTGEIYSSKSDIKLKNIPMSSFNISDYFEIKLGGKDEIEDLKEGSYPIVSTSEFNNGVSTWKEPNETYPKHLITVATDGSTCSSFVQEFPFYAFYKVAILTPKIDIPLDALYYVAYLLKRERWRYVYARKFGKGRISKTKLIMPEKNGIPDFDKMAKIIQMTKAYPIIKFFRDAIDK